MQFQINCHTRKRREAQVSYTTSNSAWLLSDIVVLTPAANDPDCPAVR